ncbi:sugar phosphate isomerase/epimerase, partial [Candidatus Woesearchaeota archaeon]|nr:sugar phosphate isomerase/epimerase [Candidatus Woesearchaeota archaeon]
AQQLGVAPQIGSTAFYDFIKDPQSYINRAADLYDREVRARVHQAEEAARQRVKAQEDLQHVRPMSEYALERTKENIAKTAIQTYDTTKNNGFKRPIYLSPENLFPEAGYGSHPEELKKIILGAREEMAKQLVQNRGLSQEEAKEAAKTHIRATFDIAHANIWRKYFKEDDPKGEKFNKWVIDETKKLIDAGVVGHVHVSDNFGYQDEHMSPGSGNAPIQDFIQEVKKAGLADEVIIEPGGHGGSPGDTIYDALFSGWKRFSNTPVYATGKINKTWEDVEGEYIGRVFSPKYMQGGYLIGAPDENWWDETTLE